MNRKQSCRIVPLVIFVAQEPAITNIGPIKLTVVGFCNNINIFSFVLSYLPPLRQTYINTRLYGVPKLYLRFAARFSSFRLKEKRDIRYLGQRWPGF